MLDKVLYKSGLFCLIVSYKLLIVLVNVWNGKVEALKKAKANISFFSKTRGLFFIGGQFANFFFKLASSEFFKVT